MVTAGEAEVWTSKGVKLSNMVCGVSVFVRLTRYISMVERCTERLKLLI